MERSVFDNMAQIDARHWWFAARRQIIGALICDRVQPPPSARILEVGCGTGSNLELLGRFGAVDAIEPDPEARAFAAKRSGVAVAGGTLPGGADLADGRYDLITLFDVLEHIPDDAGALEELARKVAPGGSLLLTVPAMPWMWSGHDVAHHHHRRYTAGSLRKTLEAAGFELRYITHFNSLLFPLIAAARGLGKVTGREGGDDAIPSGPVNGALRAVFAAERHLLPLMSLPFGVSLAVIAQPKRAAAGERLAA
jgi:SAM-dependent methyltransferase